MPRKTLRERQVTKKSAEQDLYPTDTDDTKNRVRSVKHNLFGTETADDIMVELLEVLTESGKIPSPGRIYIFVYSPKTPNIRYDQNPLVGVTDVFKWGFRGINFHWNQPRQYTWEEIVGSLYEVTRSELRDLKSMQFANFKINS
jgi:hypothetical protein